MTPNVRISGNPNINDKWKPFNGKFMSIFVSVIGKFSKVTIFAKSDDKRVKREEAVKIAK